MDPFGRLHTDSMDIWRGTLSVDGGLTRRVRTRVGQGLRCRINTWSGPSTGSAWPDQPEVYRLFTPPDRLLRGDKVVLRRGDREWIGIVISVMPFPHHDEAAVRQAPEEVL